MLALSGLLVVILVSLLITRVATVALTLTGLSRESARFQARSALSGVGFTTSEAEAVVNHPVRRRVVMALMLLGGAGTVTVIGALFLSFANADASQRSTRVAMLLGGLVALWLVARSPWVDRRLSRLITRALGRWTDLDARDYAALLHLSGSYSVMEMAVNAGDWVAGRRLEELSLRDEGVVVLGISRADGVYLGAPRFGTEIKDGDTLILYGRSPRLCELDRRPAGAVGDSSMPPGWRSTARCSGKRPSPTRPSDPRNRNGLHDLALRGTSVGMAPAAATQPCSRPPRQRTAQSCSGARRVAPASSRSGSRRPRGRRRGARALHLMHGDLGHPAGELKQARSRIAHLDGDVETHEKRKQGAEPGHERIEPLAGGGDPVIELRLRPMPSRWQGVRPDGLRAGPATETSRPSTAPFLSPHARPRGLP